MVLANLYKAVCPIDSASEIYFLTDLLGFVDNPTILPIEGC